MKRLKMVCPQIDFAGSKCTGLAERRRIYCDWWQERKTWCAGFAYFTKGSVQDDPQNQGQINLKPDQIQAIFS